MSDSIWKKEISLRRKQAQAEEAVPAEAAAPVEPPAPKQSFWKKEISLGGKGKQPGEAAPESAAPVEPSVSKQSFWKKEISLGGKGKQPGAAAAPESVAPVEPSVPKQSFWKKEISLGGKGKQPPPAATGEPSEPQEAKTPFWKKEISLSRKQQRQEVDQLDDEAAQIVARAFGPVPPPNLPAPPVAEAALVPPPEAEAPAAPVEAAARRAATAGYPPVEAPHAEAPFDEAPSVEVAPMEPAPGATEAEPVEAAPVSHSPADATAEPEPELAEPAVVAPDPEPIAVTPDSLPSSSPSPTPFRRSPAPAPSSASCPTCSHSRRRSSRPCSLPQRTPSRRRTAPRRTRSRCSGPIRRSRPARPSRPPQSRSPTEPEPEPETASRTPYPYTGLSPEIVAASAVEEPLAPLPPAPDIEFPAPALPAPAPELPQPAAAVPLEPQAAHEAAVPAFEPEPEPEPDWQPPAAEAEPWLAGPEAPPAPEPQVVLHPPVPDSELPLLASAKTPFWKKELSFSRKPKPAAQEPVLQQEPDAPRTPFWKKELSFSRKRKEFAALEQALQAVAPPPAGKKPFWKTELSFSRKPKQAVPADAAAPLPQGAKTPFWKKDLSLSRKQNRAADSAGQPAEQLPAAPKQPFWKRGLSFSAPSLSLPQRGGGRSGHGGKGSHKAKRIVGLKVGASQIAAARISNNGVAELQQLVRQPLAAGVIVGGELRDPDALADALRVFFSRNKLPRKGVRLGIASNRIGVRTFDVVDVEGEKQLANAIHFRAQEALPIPLDEAVLDYHILGESVDDEGRNVKRVLLVVAHRELVDRYVSACRKAGVALVGIDLEAFALLRSLAPPSDRGSAALVAVAIGHDRSTFAVSDGRACEFTRVLEWGGWSLNVALARALDTTPSEVETIKRAVSLEAGAAAPEGVSPEIVATALDAVRKQLQVFARELVSSLQFYQNQPGSLGIGEIVVTGGTAGLPGLAEELERMIGVHVRVGNPLARLKVGKKIEQPEQLGSLAVAIGLGIED